MIQRTPTVLSLFIQLLTLSLYAQTSLSPGDIAFSTVNSDHDSTFSFITFTPIEKGTILYITDHGYNPIQQTLTTSSFREGTLTWTATSEIPALTEIIILKPETLLQASTGRAVKHGNFKTTNNRDQIFIYQGPALNIPKTFICGFNRHPAAFLMFDFGNSEFETGIPPGLTPGITLFSTTSENNNWQFKCTELKTGNKDSLLALFMETENFNTNNGDNAFKNGALLENACVMKFSQKDSTKPIIVANQKFLLREDAPSNRTVGKIKALDAVGGTLKNWTIVAGNEDNTFQINPNSGTLSIKNNSTINFENGQTQFRNLKITVRDEHGNKSDTGVVTIQITDYKPTITIVKNRDVAEPSTNGEIAITLSEPSLKSMEVSLFALGEAQNNLDFQAIPTKVLIPANTTTVTIPIEVIDDDLTEADETVMIMISGTNNPDVQFDNAATSTIVSITDDDFQTLTIIEEVSTSKNIAIYPNPTTGTIHLQHADSTSVYEKIALYTTTGALVLEEKMSDLTDQTIRINHLNNGVYFLKMSSESTELTQRIVKH